MKETKYNNNKDLLYIIKEDYPNFDKYWNDIWVISFKGFLGKDILNN